jgi:WD40 repeat protein
VSDAVRIYELSTLRPIAQMAGSLGSFVGVAFSPNGRRVIAGDDQSVAWLWDVDSGREVGRFEGGVTLARFQPDSDAVVIVRRQSCELLRAPSWAEIAATESEGKKKGKQ